MANLTDVLRSQIQSLTNPLEVLSLDLLDAAAYARIQNELYPGRPYRPPESFIYTDPLPALAQEITRDGYLYVGVDYRAGTHHTPARAARENHWIFARREGNKSARFIYIPTRLSANGLQILQLPVWTFDGGTADFCELPGDELLPSEVGEWPRCHLLTCGDYYHPLYFGLWHTGRVVETVGGRPLWEYQDRLGWLGLRGQMYLSIYPPLDMDYPLGVPIGGQLVRDGAVLEGELYLPAAGLFDRVGYYLGYRTSRAYSNVPFYLYQRPGGVFLSMEPPVLVYVDNHWNRAIPRYCNARYIWDVVPYAPLADIRETYEGTHAARLARQSQVRAWGEVL